MKKFLTIWVLGWLRFWAKIKIKRDKPTIIGVAGSAGKSSAVQAIWTCLRKEFRAKPSTGKNSETGLPLNILNIELKNYSVLDWIRVCILCPIQAFSKTPKIDYYIAELGVDEPLPPKNMAYLTTIVQPNIAVILNILLEHSENYDFLTISNKPAQREKEILKFNAEDQFILIKKMPAKGTAILNWDNPWTQQMAQKTKKKVVFFSLKKPGSDFFADKIKNDLTGFSMRVIYQKRSYNFKIKNPLPKFYAETFLASLAAVVSAGLKIEKAIKNLEKKFVLPPGRMTIFKGIKKTTILDSSYNASTKPVLGALELLNEIGQGKRKIAILGDMRELGQESKGEHQKVAKEILATANMAVLVGPEMKKWVAPILKRRGFSFLAFETFSQSKEKILENIRGGEIILVKGSQNTLFLERVVEMLLKDKKDRKRLCRGGSFWQEKRKLST